MDNILIPIYFQQILLNNCVIMAVLVISPKDLINSLKVIKLNSFVNLTIIIFLIL